METLPSRLLVLMHTGYYPQHLPPPATIQDLRAIVRVLPPQDSKSRDTKLLLIYFTYLEIFSYCHFAKDQKYTLLEIVFHICLVASPGYLICEMYA